MMTVLKLFCLCTLYLVCQPLLFAQNSPPKLKLEEAINLALNNYPAIRASQAQADAAREGIDLARTAYLPRIDLIWQENRATRNNVFGLLLPQGVIPAISGPVLGTNSLSSTWGSASGMLFSWEPFDFGLRKANVNVARTTLDQANAQVEVTELDVATTAADSFLAVIAAEERVRAAQANVDRLEVFAKTVHVLVDNQLRAGAEASRADAELAVARNLLIQAEQNAEISRATLADALGIAGTPITVDPGPLLQLPTIVDIPIPKFESHPVARAQEATVEIVHARKHVLDRSYFPKFNFQTAMSGRGSGAKVNGQIEENEGLVPTIANLAMGMTISFSAFDIFGLRARRRIEANNEIAERARYERTIQLLKTEDARSRALTEAAQRIAQNTPIQLKAAQETEARARARFDAGLGTISEIAEAQRLLAQAEIDDSVARLNIWRAMLTVARVQGDIKPFVEQVMNTPILPGRK